LGGLATTISYGRLPPIPLSLNKLLRYIKASLVRNLAIYNSTFLILRRIKRLRLYFTLFYNRYKRSDLILDNDK
ncbi:hypothetical protein N7516_005893, partial [Penicillium verrucosum]|uniref:uncharacterized protein n=1 Tax=Penicillium verrucosum TaxID=60171 RepID=UPI0025450D33